MWNSASEFLAMGGYALYVWSSFGLCAIAFCVEAVSYTHLTLPTILRV